MTRLFLALLCAGLTFGATGCRIVKDEPEDTKAIAADASGDEQRIDLLLNDTFDTEVLPNIRNGAVEVATLRQAVAEGIDAAGETYGNRGAGAGSAWAFPVKGSGTVISANLESRARSAEVDTDGDGAADLSLQLGPVFKGTGLRDVSPIFVFTEFRDQIEFARLAREMNDRMKDSLVVPEGELVGQNVSFIGAVSLKDASEPFVVTPVEIRLAQ